MTEITALPKCPAELPNVDVNKIEFETGYEERYVVGGFPSNWFQCSICQGFPRRPATLAKCGHLFCERCLKELYETNSWLHAHATDGFDRTCFCPMCKKEFATYEVFVFEAFQQWAKCLFLSISIRCPYECGFVGNALQVDEHQVRHCKNRIVACPHLDCPIKLQADKMEKHFQECDFRRVFCSKCKLAVLATLERTHNCVDTLQAALICMMVFVAYLWHPYGEFHSLLMKFEKWFLTTTNLMKTKEIHKSYI